MLSIALGGYQKLRRSKVNSSVASVHCEDLGAELSHTPLRTINAFPLVSAASKHGVHEPLILVKTSTDFFVFCEKSKVISCSSSRYNPIYPE